MSVKKIIFRLTPIGGSRWGSEKYSDPHLKWLGENLLIVKLKRFKICGILMWCEVLLLSDIVFSRVCWLKKWATDNQGCLRINYWLILFFGQLKTLAESAGTNSLKW